VLAENQRSSSTRIELSVRLVLFRDLSQKHPDLTDGFFDHFAKGLPALTFGCESTSECLDIFGVQVKPRRPPAITTVAS
jgi:hypothetical protein